MTLVLMLSLIACDGGGDGTQTQEAEEQDTSLGGDDNISPLVEHDEVVSPQSASGNVSVTATITDENTIVNTAVYYRAQTSANWNSVGMAEQAPDIYVGTLTPGDLQSAGMHYYVEAVDQYGNTATLPDGAPNDYFKFDLVE